MPPYRNRRRARRYAGILVLALAAAELANAHIVPAEKLHPVAESYRRLSFSLRLNPIGWIDVEKDARRIGDALTTLDAAAGESYAAALGDVLPGDEPLDPSARRAAAQRLFGLATEAVVQQLAGHLEAASRHLDDHRVAASELATARQIWAAFEPEIRATDPEAYRELGECWLELSSALGSPGVFGQGAVDADPEAFAEDATEIAEYMIESFADTPPKVGTVAALPPTQRPLAPLPAHSPTFDASAAVPARLPPGSNINKQLPRPRQVLNMAIRGVDEGETGLIALGDMAFDSAAIFGEPARSLGISCNTCHNKSITNPAFFIPGLSARPGTVDVSNSFFAPHANNGHFDPLDIPDLRGIRFTAPYGRNGRFDSLREFTRNVIVNEFNGPEPDPMLLDGMIAYMLEFDFLSNRDLGADGRLTASASESARRGEALFSRPFEQMSGRSCATCHVPSDHFLDRRRHDIGSVGGAEESSRDRALDTPTLLSSRYTAPYFHDGSLPTLRAVVEWFNDRFALDLDEAQVVDLTAYLETVGDGIDAYEDTVHTLDAELEEFSFFLSTYELLRAKRKPELIETTFETIAFELRAHKWDVQDRGYLDVLERLAVLMDEALEAERRGEVEAVDERVAEYRRLYGENVEVLR